MATTPVAHRPELTAEQAMEVFSRQLGDGYDVFEPTGLGKWLAARPHFVVKDGSGASVGVWLLQKKDSTTSRTAGILPPIAYVGVLGAMVGMLVTGGIAWMLLSPKWKEIEADITLCIENAVEFN